MFFHDLNSKRVLGGTFSLFKLLVKLKPSVVFSSITHVNLLISLIIPLAKPFLKKTIFVAREVNNPSVRSRFLKTSKNIDFLYKKSILNFHLIIAQSNYMRNDILNSYDIEGDKVIVVNNPLDFKGLILKSKQPLETSFRIKGKLNITAVGNLRVQKGLDLLLNIVEKLDDKFHVNIIGEGSERRKLERLIFEKNIGDKVTLHGEKRNPYNFMFNSDLIVLCSRYEGFPNVILEANACSKYVIAYKVPGVNEEIIKEGINGTLVNFEDEIDFSEKIKMFKEMNIDAKLIRKSIAKYDSKSIVKKYIEIFDLIKI